ncbi:hypothetical protein QWZ16_23355 [Vibrio ostreicida]|uniref:Uncharacterized protein n=1 Tax=Vibrio ostreicida TaxID=526588 RepID=A0ABT8BZE9_9VIBR|nr:hypothetical protein [Vibrio ostreicida]MDN3612540.1 hypothetical protein [Vibrio ostreicida]
MMAVFVKPFLGTKLKDRHLPDQVLLGRHCQRLYPLLRIPKYATTRKADSNSGDGKTNSITLISLRYNAVS